MHQTARAQKWLGCGFLPRWPDLDDGGVPSCHERSSRLAELRVALLAAHMPSRTIRGGLVLGNEVATLSRAVRRGRLLLYAAVTVSALASWWDWRQRAIHILIIVVAGRALPELSITL
jgi:hypothetical protein